MRIALVTDQYPPMVGGVSTVVKTLSTELAERGHQVWVIAPSDCNLHGLEQEGPVTVHRFSSFEWPTYEGLRIAWLPFIKMFKLLKEIDPDVIHIHSPIVLGNIARIAGKRLHKPILATNHFLPMNMSRSLSRDPILSRGFRSIVWTYLVNFYNRCDFVTAPTKTARDLLVNHGMKAAGKAISNGIKPSEFHPGAPDTDLRDRLGLPAGTPLALYVGRLSGEKRLDVLLDAAAKILDTTAAHIVIGGTGPDKEILQEQAERLGIAGQVSFLGFVADEDLPKLYRLATVFVMPSEAELQSIATLEAMASQLPVIVADAYALPELVHQSKNGYTFAHGNPDDLAAKMKEILSDPAHAAEMGRCSLQMTAAHQRDAIIDEWEHIYCNGARRKQQEQTFARRWFSETFNR